MLQVSRRAPGGGFSAPLTVGGTTGATDVRVGVDGAGNATVVFAQGGQIRVLAWPAAAGGPGAPTSFEAGGSPELAVGRGGTAVATWLENPASMTPRVRAAVRPGASGGFGAPATISDFGNGASSITGLQVDVGDGGHATVVWSRQTLVPNVRLVEANERVRRRVREPRHVDLRLGRSRAVDRARRCRRPDRALDRAVDGFRPGQVRGARPG